MQLHSLFYIYLLPGSLGEKFQQVDWGFCGHVFAEASWCIDYALGLIKCANSQMSDVFSLCSFIFVLLCSVHSDDTHSSQIPLTWESFCNNIFYSAFPPLAHPELSRALSKILSKPPLLYVALEANLAPVVLVLPSRVLLFCIAWAMLSLTRHKCPN